MEKVEDTRFLRIKHQILTAVITLLQHKDFSKISVRDICETAGVSRSGFYLHYEDKYDLVQQYQRELMVKMAPIFKQNLQWDHYQLFLTLITLMANEGQLIMLLLSENGVGEIQQQMQRVVRQNIQQNVLPFASRQPQSPAEEQYLIIFLSSGVYGIIREWLQGGKRETPEELAMILNQFVLKCVE